MKSYILPIVLGLWVGLGHAFISDSGPILWPMFYMTALRMMVEYAICFTLMAWIFRSIGLARWPVIWVPLAVVCGSITGQILAMSIPNILFNSHLPPQEQEPMSRVIREELWNAVLGFGILGPLLSIPVFIVLGVVAGVMKLVRRHPPNTMAT